MVKIEILSGFLLSLTIALNADLTDYTYDYVGDDFDNTMYSGLYSSGVERNISVSITLIH